MTLVGAAASSASLTTPRPLGKPNRNRPLPPGSLVSTSVGSSGCSEASSRAANEENSSSSDGASPAADAQAMTIQRLQCFKTKRCKFWQEGRCTRGERCTYAHTEVELRVPPDLTKTKICTRWKRGTCDKNPQDCAYAHGCDDLRDAHNIKSPVASRQNPDPLPPPAQRNHSLSDTASTASASSETETLTKSRWDMMDDSPPPCSSLPHRFDYLVAMSQVCQSLTDFYSD